MPVTHAFRVALACTIAVVSLSSFVTAAPAQATESPPVGYMNKILIGSTPIPIIASGSITLHSTTIGEVHCINSFYAFGKNEHENGEESKPLKGVGEVVGWGNSSCEAPQETKSLESLYPKDAPITVTATAEMPLSERVGEGEFCTEESKTKLSECTGSGERSARKYIAAFIRRVTTLPWEVELVRGERLEEVGILEKVGFPDKAEREKGVTNCYPTEGEAPVTFEHIPAGCIGVNIVFPQIPLEFTYYGTQEIFTVNGAGNGLSPSRMEFLEAGNLASSHGSFGVGSTTGELHLWGVGGQELLTAE